MSASPASTRRVIGSIQRHLTAIYRIDPVAHASDFLLEEEHRARLASREKLPESDGLLLVLEEAGDVWIGLYLDSRVRGELEAQDPYARLDAGNLRPFLTAVEETSHFLFLLWSVGNGRSVSRFQLELQGEVDKFASSALVLKGQGWRPRESRSPGDLHQILFGAAEIDTRLDEEDAPRYLAAHQLAARYCRTLEERYLPSRGLARIPAMLMDLRRFYRLPGSAKIRHILAN